VTCRSDNGARLAGCRSYRGSVDGADFWFSRLLWPPSIDDVDPKEPNGRLRNWFQAHAT